MDDISKELIKILVQFVLLGLIGSAITFLYSRNQKNREMRISALEKLASLHGRFLALRYEFNSFFIRWRGRQNTTKSLLDNDEILKQKWACYTRSCQLIGEYQSLRPLLSVLFPGHDREIDILYSFYQEWRRQSGADRPIFQELDGRSAENFKQLRDQYGSLVKALKAHI